MLVYQQYAYILLLAINLIVDWFSIFTLVQGCHTRHAPLPPTLGHAQTPYGLDSEAAAELSGSCSGASSCGGGKLSHHSPHPP